MKSLKYFIFLSFFILTFSSFSVHGCIWGNIKRFFGFGKPKNTSYEMPIVANKVDYYSSTSSFRSPNRNFKDFVIYVAMKFQHKGKDLYFPVNLYNFTLAHIDIHTKLPKFKKRIAEALPKGLYGLELNDIQEMEVLIQNIPMTTEDNLKSLIQNTGTGGVSPVKVLLLIHPSNEWVKWFKNMDYEKLNDKAKKELKKKKEEIIEEMNDFFSSINISFGLNENSQLYESTLNKICLEESKQYSNKNVRLLIHNECQRWKRMLKEAYHTYEKQRQHYTHFH